MSGRLLSVDVVFRKEIRNRNLQCHRQFFNILQGQISRTPLNIRYVGAVQAGTFGQSFLRYVYLEAPFLYGGAESTLDVLLSSLPDEANRTNVLTISLQTMSDNLYRLVPSRLSEIEPLALPKDEIRRLVILTTARYKIEPFVRKLIRLMDDLKTGPTNNIAKLTKPGRDKSRTMLFAAIAKTVNEGRTMAAYHTTYQATLYAYENSLDHLLAFHEYLDRFKQRQPNTPPT